jgi:hypothetical protein
MMTKYIDLVGQKFGKLTVIKKVEHLPNSTSRSAKWLCVCDCGKQISTISNSLRSGRAKTCGCSAGQHQIIHGKTKTPEFVLWTAMIERCRNPNHRAYKNYGSRGITVCDSWHTFQNFYDDMCPRPSPNLQLDRLNNNLGYSKENCRWVTRKENLRNKRNNHKVTIKGVLMTVSQAAEILNLSASGIAYRKKHNLSLE